MNPDDLEPRKQKPAPKDLTVLSVAELNDYIAELEGEIARARAAIDAKQSHKNAAEALFKR
ncbi:DUF1192 domain-containing protein [Azospirillum sp. ST 5-10]|uniref:DUF1192 domain-containing protein n=1 Tax=unclassified Azospirillum TaxID=2630922 RepID=UPI003F4A82C5